MKKLVLVLAALMLLCSCAVAEPASVVETGAGIKVIPASEWEATYPDVYASYMKNQENSAVIDHVEEYPQIATVYEGMASSIPTMPAIYPAMRITRKTSNGCAFTRSE